MRNYAKNHKYLIVTLIICGFGMCTSCGRAEEPIQVENNTHTTQLLPENTQTAESDARENTDSPQKPSPLPESRNAFGSADVSPNEPPSQSASTQETENSPQANLPSDKREPSQTPPTPSKTENSSQQSTDEQSDDEIETEPLIGRKLTPEELQIYTELLQDRSNYGFLLSNWDDPTEINLFEIFYNGATIYRVGTEAEIEAFLARNQQDALYTDFWVIDKTAMNNFLLEKVGLTYDAYVMKGGKSMDDDYYAEFDSFCWEAGDTNYCMFVCTDGVENEEGTIVTLRYEATYSWIQKGEVQMHKDGRFIYNHVLKGEILEPSE